jgi:hypothetical protein
VQGQSTKKQESTRVPVEHLADCVRRPWDTCATSLVVVVAVVVAVTVLLLLLLMLLLILLLTVGVVPARRDEP